MSSKKMKRLVLILCVVLVFAVGGYLIADFVITQKENAVAEEEASLHLYSFEAGSIDTVTLDTKEGFFKMEIVDSVWTITETDYPYDLTLNTAYVSTVCSYLSGLTAETKFDSDPSRLADYGLEDPVVLTCSAGSTDYTLYVGNAAPTQEYFYAMVPGNDTVYGIDFEYGSVFYGDTSYLKSPYILPYNDVDIKEIALEREGEIIYDLKQEDNVWTMEKPVSGAAINIAQVNSMVTALVRIEIAGFVGMVSEGFDPAEYDLDTPRYTLTVKTADGKSKIIDFAPYDPNDGIVYMMYRNEQEIAYVSQGNIGFLNTELAELMNEKIHMINFSSVAAVDATVDDLSFRMEMDAASGTYLFDGMDISTLGEDAESTFKALYDTMSNLKFEELDFDANVDVTAEPAASFRYTLTDGTETELSLIAIDDTSYWALVDGEYTGMTVRRRSLSGSTGVLTFHERMMDLIAEAQSSAS